MNTYSDQRTDVSVFGAGFTDDNTHGCFCNLSGDHVSGDLDTIASSSRGGCDQIASGGRVCSVCNVTLMVESPAAFAPLMAATSAVCTLLAVSPAVAMVAATALPAMTAVAATASPAAAMVAAMALPPAAAFVVFITSTLIVELPAAFAPLMAAASTTGALLAMLPSTLTSVHSL